MTATDTIDLLRVVYFSRRAVQDPATAAAEIAAILDRSRANNARDDVGGALMFNGRAFGQVLEGPATAVEAAFERIQSDPRHAEVTVLSLGPIATRGFPGWSMAFAGEAEMRAAGAGPEADLETLDADALCVWLGRLMGRQTA